MHTLMHFLCIRLCKLCAPRLSSALLYVYVHVYVRRKRLRAFSAISLRVPGLSRKSRLSDLASLRAAYRARFTVFFVGIRLPVFRVPCTTVAFFYWQCIFLRSLHCAMSAWRQRWVWE